MTRKWKRDKSQETGNVLRWYERGKTTASIVKGDFPQEVETRVSGAFGSVSSRGSKRLVMDAPEPKKMRKLDILIRREKMFKKPVIPRIKRR